MKKDYPTNKELKIIEDWDFTKQSVKNFLDFIKKIWNWANVGFYQLKGKRILRLELHTGGWSGNEDIIVAIQNNELFWLICWQKSVRGGHYYFRIPLKSFRGETKKYNRPINS
jgi:hypothetical protein